MAKETQTFVSPIGGQALLEGVLMRSPHSLAMAVRDNNGKLVVCSERLSERRWYNKVPILRGFFAFISSLVSSMKYLVKSLEPISEEDEKLTKGETAFSLVLGILLAVGLFAALPRLINWLVVDLWLDLPTLWADSNYLYVLITNLISGVIRVGVLVAYMAVISKMKSIYRMYGYHGAEHRTINCYEHRRPLTVENVQACSTRHNRCGTTFLFYTVMVSILMSIILAFLLALCGINVNSVIATVGGAGALCYNLILIGVNLACFPITAGLSYEFLRLMAKLPDNAFTMIFKAPGLALQKLTTKIPDDSQAEAAILAFKTVLALDEDKSLPALDFYEARLSDMRREITEKYAAAKIDEECEVDWLFCEVLGLKRGELSGCRVLTKAETARLRAMTDERVSGKPLDYVTGKSEFYGYTLSVDKRVLVPRLDTEEVTRRALEIIGDGEGKRVLDLMTGSGAIALAIANRSRASVTASDVSDDALAVARDNLPSAVSVVKSDVLCGIKDTFDLIISNPPYIRDGDIDGLQAEVCCQPRMALSGGEDGLKFYRLIAEQAPRALNNGGTLVLEIGFDQAEAVAEILKDNFDDIKVFKDLGGNDRTVIATVRNNV